MKDRVYIDASFFVALSLAEHPFNERATKKMKTLKHSHLYFSLLTLDEVLHAFEKYHFPKEKILDHIQNFFMQVQNLFCIGHSNDLSSVQNYLSIWNANVLGPRDALHLYFMKESGIHTIATFDQDFIEKREKLGIKVL